MNKYKSIFLLSLFLTQIFSWLDCMSGMIPAYASYAFIFQIFFCISYPVAYIAFFMALKSALLTLRLSRQLDVLKREEASDEIAKLSLKFEKVRMHSVCADSLLNAILLERKELAKEHHISVNYQILLPDHLDFPNTVLSSIFFNLLDNGIEACIQSNIEQSFLTLSVQCKANFLHINMENSKNAHVIFDRKTTKPNPEEHGYGLAIIEEIVDKYDGSCEWIDRGDSFQSMLMLRTDVYNTEDKRYCNDSYSTI